MFSGLCFLLNGNMAIGLHGDKMGGGAMFRVGAEEIHDALTISGTKPMVMNGRPMKAYVDLDQAELTADEPATALVAMALHFVATFPTK